MTRYNQFHPPPPPPDGAYLTERKSPSSRVLIIQLETWYTPSTSFVVVPPLPANDAPRRLHKPGKVALGILGLRTHPSLRFLGFGGSNTDDGPGHADEDTASIWEDDEEAVGDEAEEEEDVGQWQSAATNVETDGDGEHDGLDDDEGSSSSSSSSSSTFAAGAEAAVRSTISKVGGEWTRFTQDVSEATEGLLAAVNKAGTSVGDAADAVVEATSGVRGMSSEEFALTALLLKQLAAGGGPTPDQVLQLVQKCEREGARPQKGMSRYSETMTAGDLIIPGNVRDDERLLRYCSVLLPRVWRFCVYMLLGTEGAVWGPVGRCACVSRQRFLMSLVVAVQGRSSICVLQRRVEVW